MRISPAQPSSERSGPSGFGGSFHIFDLDVLNITYYSQDGKAYLTLQLTHNGSNIDLKVNDSVVSTIYYTPSSAIKTFPYLDHYDLILNNLTSTVNKSITSSPYEEIVSYIGLQGNATIHRFFYSGSTAEPTFTTVQPTNMTVTTTGLNYLNFYISDSINQPGTYRKYTIPVYIYASDMCEYAQPQGIGKGLNPVADVDVLGFIKSWFGVSLKGYLTDMGYYDTGEKLLWFIFVITFLGLVFLFYTLSHSLSLETPLIISAFAVGFIAFMVDYTTIFVSMLIIIALGFALPLARIFIGGGE